MNSGGVAYVSDDPQVLAAVKADRERAAAWTKLTVSYEASIPGAKHFILGSFLGDRKVLGLSVVDPDVPPPGWRWSKRHRWAVPRQGRVGEKARAVIDELNAARPRMVRLLADVGAPNAVSRGDGFGRLVISVPMVVVAGGTVHLHYKAEPTVDNTKGWSTVKGAPDGRWKPEPLSAFYAALEAVQAIDGKEGQ